MRKTYKTCLRLSYIQLKKIGFPIRNYKLFIGLMFLVILLFQESCEKEPNCVCGVKYPEKNLLWLKEKLERRFSTEVYSLTFKDIEYIVVCDVPQVNDSMIQFFDCIGNKTCEWGGFGGFCNMPVDFTYEIFKQNRKLIYLQP